MDRQSPSIIAQHTATSLFSTLTPLTLPLSHGLHTILLSSLSRWNYASSSDSFGYSMVVRGVKTDATGLLGYEVELMVGCGQLLGCELPFSSTSHSQPSRHIAEHSCNTWLVTDTCRESALHITPSPFQRAQKK